MKKNVSYTILAVLAVLAGAISVIWAVWNIVVINLKQEAVSCQVYMFGQF